MANTDDARRRRVTSSSGRGNFVAPEPPTSAVVRRMSLTNDRRRPVSAWPVRRRGRVAASTAAGWTARPGSRTEESHTKSATSRRKKFQSGVRTGSSQGRRRCGKFRRGWQSFKPRRRRQSLASSSAAARSQPRRRRGRQVQESTRTRFDIDRCRRSVPLRGSDAKGVDRRRRCLKQHFRLVLAHL